MTEDFEGLRFFRINSFAQANTSEIEIYDIKIEKGNKASGYSPYGMGSINEKIQTRNLFDGTREVNSTYTNSIKTALQNYKNTGKYATGYINNNNIIASDNRLFTAFTEIQSGEVYTIDNTYSATANFSLICFLDKDGNVISKNTEWSSQAYTHTATNEEKYIAVGAFLTSLNYIQIEPGSTATPYVPHKEQDYSIFVQQPMRSIGDVRDLFFKNVKDSKYYNKDLEENKWYERHYIGEAILDGSRVWNKSSYSDEKYFCGFLATGISDLIDGGLNLNNFFRIGIYTTILDEECMSNSFQLNVRILASRLTENSANGFKQWLSTHNVKAYGRYVTPLDLPCTETQIQQLENKPSTYKDFTIIQSEDETKAYLEVAGIYDLNKLINN